MILIKACHQGDLQQIIESIKAGVDISKADPVSGDTVSI